MLRKTWEGADLSTVSRDGASYLYSLLCDYERYIDNFHFITIQDFLQGWTCISREDFVNLTCGDRVYTPQGQEYVVMEEPWESDDETCVYVEVTMVKDDGTFDNTGRLNEILCTGDLYACDKIHMDYFYKVIKRKESEEPICPILITKTNQPQS